MGLVHTVLKCFCSIPLLTGPLMLLIGLGLASCPDPMCKANGGIGADKFDWAESFSGVPKAAIFCFLGICKMCAFADIYFLRVVPRLALLCTSIMMACVTYGHVMVGDDLPPCVVLTLTPLAAIVTWPKAPAKGGKGS